MCDSDTCGPTPLYLCMDGKVTGPTQEMIRNIEELDRDQNDQRPLGQGSTSEMRVFLSVRTERELVKYDI